LVVVEPERESERKKEADEKNVEKAGTQEK